MRAEDREDQLVRLRHGLPLLVGDLRETAGIEGMAAAVLDALRDGVRADRAALLVGDTVTAARGIEVERVEAWRGDWVPFVREGLDCDRSDPLFPMRVPLDSDGMGGSAGCCSGRVPTAASTAGTSARRWRKSPPRLHARWRL